VALNPDGSPAKPAWPQPSSSKLSSFGGSSRVGILMASRLAVGDPNIGIGFEFDVIVAVILGGTSLAGGEGSIVGMIIGALVIGSLGTGLKLMNVFTFFQSIMKGVVLVLAVLLDQNLKTRLRRFGARRASPVKAAAETGDR